MAVYKAGARKRAPTRPGAIVASALEELGVSIHEAASAMGMRQTRLRSIIAGSSVDAAAALRLGKYLGNGPQLWLAMQNDVDIWNAQHAIGHELAWIRRAPRKRAAS